MSTTIYSANSLFHDSDGYYHLIYMIVNKINNKIYIGKHTTKNPYDDYMGSGKAINAAIKKYGLENFEKTILYCFDSEDKAYLKESEIVDETFVKRSDTYNMKCGGKGFKSYELKNEKNYWYGKNRTNDNNPMYGHQHSEKTKQHISEKAKKRYINSENHPMKGIHHCKETIQFLSEKLKDYYKNNPEKAKEHSEKLKDYYKKQENRDRLLGEKNPMYGMYSSKHPVSKPVKKIDVNANIVFEYGCMKDCYESEHISKRTLSKYINSGKLYKGCYYYNI